MHVGRRDLADDIITEISQKNQKLEDRRNYYIKPMWFIMYFLIIVLFYDKTYYYFYNNTNITTMSENVTENNKTSSEQCIGADLIHTLSNHTNESCSRTLLTDGNLPMHDQEIFVGRENDVLEVMRSVDRANIVNINGAPGFGKSTVAIHVGHHVIKHGTLVQYINVEDKLFSFYNSFKTADGENKKSDSELLKQKQDFETRSLTELGTPSLLPYKPKHFSEYRHYHDDFHDELINWSESINCFVVLILDNCDDVISSFLGEFTHFIKSLVHRSHDNLHIIITSRIKMSNWFVSWTVKELNMTTSILLLDKIAPGISVDNLTEIAKVVEGCPLALKVIGQLIDRYGEEIAHHLRKDIMVLLEKTSNRRERFPIIMEATLSKLEMLKDCSYMYTLSLFPGSFDKRAADAIITTSDTQEQECKSESYVKHSLLDEYFIPHQRYQMHRLIREYLKNRVLTSDKRIFAKRLKAYFVTFLLKYATKQELDYVQMQTVTTEMHNLYYLKVLLMSENHLSARELAALAFLTNIQQIVTLEELLNFYPMYMLKVNEILLYLNPDLCRKLYLHIVKYLYEQCKCETLSEYVQNFFNSTCMEYFQCATINTLNQILQQPSSTALEDESSFLNRVSKYHCREVYYQQYSVSDALSASMYFVILNYNYTKKQKLIIYFLAFAMLTMIVDLINISNNIYTQQILHVQPLFIETTATEICHSTLNLFGYYVMLYFAILIMEYVKVYLFRRIVDMTLFHIIAFLLPLFISTIFISIYIFIRNTLQVTRFCKLIPICL